jgi:hypothetical protein
MQSLKYGQPVLEHDVLELQAQYTIDIRRPGQRSALDAPTVGLHVRNAIAVLAPEQIAGRQRQLRQREVQ